MLINDIKDRHVLATAIRAGATTIVTFNLRDFSAPALAPWDIHAVHPADYLITLLCHRAGRSGGAARRHGAYQKSGAETLCGKARP
jgi:hypothetical protein